MKPYLLHPITVNYENNVNEMPSVMFNRERTGAEMKLTGIFLLLMLWRSESARVAGETGTLVWRGIVLFKVMRLLKCLLLNFRLKLCT